MIDAATSVDFLATLIANPPDGALTERANALGRRSGNRRLLSRSATPRVVNHCETRRTFIICEYAFSPAGARIASQSCGVCFLMVRRPSACPRRVARLTYRGLTG